MSPKCEAFYAELASRGVVGIMLENYRLAFAVQQDCYYICHPNQSNVLMITGQEGSLYQLSENVFKYDNLSETYQPKEVSIRWVREKLWKVVDEYVSSEVTVETEERGGYDLGVIFKEKAEDIRRLQEGMNAEDKLELSLSNFSDCRGVFYYKSQLDPRLIGVVPSAFFPKGGQEPISCFEVEMRWLAMERERVVYQVRSMEYGDTLEVREVGRGRQEVLAKLAGQFRTIKERESKVILDAIAKQKAELEMEGMRKEPMSLDVELM